MIEVIEKDVVLNRDQAISEFCIMMDMLSSIEANTDFAEQMVRQMPPVVIYHICEGIQILFELCEKVSRERMNDIKNSK